jgi:cobalt-zinc-cadmium efflux system membrane fusion protein
MRRIPPLPLALLLAVLGCAVAEGGSPRNWEVDGDGVTLARQTRARFDVAEVVLGDPLPGPSFAARVTTLESLTSPSFPPLAGRVRETLVHIGDPVEQGARLVRIQTPDLPTLEGELAAAKLAVQTKAATVEKLEQMVEARLAAERELVVARAELAEARLQAKTAKARLRSLSLDRSRDSSYWILANRSGTVVQLDAALGLRVGPDQSQPVATVADLDEVLVITDLPQREAQRVQPGATARVHVPGSMEEPLTGTVELVSDLVDPDRQTVPLRIRVANVDRRLRPNAYVDVSLEPTAREPVVRVTAGAVVRDGSRTVVFVATGDNAYHAREVELGRRTKDEVEVVRGLRPGEKIVTTNALLLLNAIDLES